jgi:hypothetical protein
MYTIFRSSFFILFIFCLNASKPVSGQNVFDSLHTAEYASFLFLSGNYKLAIDEYERLHFQHTLTELQALRLVLSYRYDNRPQFALKRMSLLWEEPEKVSPEVLREYLILQTMLGNYGTVIESVRTSKMIADQEKNFFEASALILQQDYNEAFRFLEPVHATSPVLANYYHLSSEALNMKHKSPFLSGMMSAVVPGSGKIYTGEWQDGLISLLFVASTAWQSYRGFGKNGIESPYGWIMGAVSAGFYAGNIYGSVKSANKYNAVKRNNISLRVQATFHHHIH